MCDRGYLVALFHFCRRDLDKCRRQLGLVGVFQRINVAIRAFLSARNNHLAVTNVCAENLHSAAESMPNNLLPLPHLRRFILSRRRRMRFLPPLATSVIFHLMTLGVGFRGAPRPGIVNVWPVEIPLFSRKREVIARVE